MTFAQRFLLTLVIVIALLFALAAFGYFSGRWQDADAQPRHCMTLEARERIRELTLQGLDDAMRQRSEHLFETWMADDRDQPKRAQNGIQKAAHAYALSLRLVAQWDPPIC